MNHEIIAERPQKTVYRDGETVIKLMNAGFPAPDALNEALNLAIVYETGFCVPRLVEVKTIEGRWAIVMEYIEGRTAAELIEENPAETDAILGRFVDIQLEMHKKTASRLRHHTDKMHAKISESGVDASARYELHTRLNGLPKHSKLCHGDYVPDNVIFKPDGGFCVIDWSHATQGNASADAARTYLRLRLAGKDTLAEKYIRLFCGKSDTARQYVEKWMAIVAASQLVKEKPEEREFLLSWANVAEYQ